MAYRYYVNYGGLSRASFSSWAAAAAFIKHCLDSGTPITAVTKEAT